MRKTSIKLLTLFLIYLSFSNCSKQPAGIEPDLGSIALIGSFNIVKSHDHKIALKKNLDLLGEIIASATISVSGSGMSTITKDFDVPDSTLEAKIDNVPVGKNRQVMILLKSHRDIGLVEGFTTVDVEAGKTSKARIEFTLRSGIPVNYSAVNPEMFDTPRVDQVLALRISPQRFPCYLKSISVFLKKNDLVYNNQGAAIGYSDPFAEYGLSILDNKKNVIAEYIVQHSDFYNVDGWHTMSLWDYNHEFNSGDFYIALQNSNDPSFNYVPWFGVHTAIYSGRSEIYSNGQWFTYGYNNREWTPMIQAELIYK